MNDYQKDRDWLISKGFIKTHWSDNKREVWKWSIDPCILYINTVIPNDDLLGCYSVVSIGTVPENLLQSKERKLTAEDSTKCIVQELIEKDWMMDGMTKEMKQSHLEAFDKLLTYNE